MFYAENLPEVQSSANSNVPVRLLFTGRFCARKGAKEIVGLCELLMRRSIPYVLDVVGDCSAEKKLVSRCEEKMLPILFHGQKPRTQLPRYLANADIYVFPSYVEGCAQSGMEAMAAGLCVIATRESGLPITDGENGSVVPCGNIEAMADRIAIFAGNRSSRVALGREAARLVSTHYTWLRYSQNLALLAA